MKNYLGLDIGGTNTKFGIVTEEGKVLFSDKFPTEKNKEKFFQVLTQLAKKYKLEYNISGIGVSMTGIVDTAQGLLITAGGVTELYDCYMKRELEERRMILRLRNIRDQFILLHFIFIINRVEDIKHNEERETIQEIMPLPEQIQ